MPKRPEILIKDFVHALELEPTIVIDFDPQLFGTAANNGQMVEEVSGNSKAAEQFRALAYVLADRTEPETEPESLLGPILASALAAIGYGSGLSCTRSKPVRCCTRASYPPMRRRSGACSV